MALAFAILLALLPVPAALASTADPEERETKESTSTAEQPSPTTPRGSDPAETLKKVAAGVVEPQLGRPSDRVIDAKTLEDLPELQDPSSDPVPVPDAVKHLPVKAAQPWESDTEIVQERTATSKTFRADEPGRFKQKIYAEPVHFKDGKSWREIKEQLVESTNDDTKRKNKANSFGLQVAERADDPDLATVELDKNHSVAFGMQGAAGVTGKVAGNTITYSRVNRHTDVKLTSEKKGLKEELILSSPKAPDEFVFPLKLKGLTASINEHGEVIFADAAGKARAITPHGFMYDSNVDPRSDEPAMSMGVTYELVEHSNGQALVVKLDRQWLDSKDRVWPVTVDPVIYPLNAKVDDTYVMKPFNRDNSHDPELKVGTYDGGSHTARSFIHFDTSALVGKKIDLAYFYMLEKHSYNCSYPPGNVYRVGDDSWQGSAIRTWPGPAVVGSAIPGTWYGSECHNRMAYWTVTDLVQQWANSGSANGSLSTWGSSETNSNYWKKYKSSEVGGAPFMYIEYSAGDPFGYLDYVANVPGVGNGAGQIYVSGWGIDPDTTGAIQAHAYAGPSGQPMAWGIPLTANLNRPDVGQAYPAYGPNHGYQGNITVPGPGTYDVCVALINVGQGTTKWLPCQSITVTNAPSAPTNAAATGNSDGSVSVSWGHPTQNGGSPVHLYNVLATYPDGSLATYKICNYPCTSVKFTGLSLGTSYRFDVYALNSVAYSPPGAAGTVVPATKPGAPTSVGGTGGATVAEVSWTPPQSNGSPITKVIVTATGEGITKTVTCQDATCLAANKVLVPDLVAGSYTFVAKAVNAVGTGPSSGSSPAIDVLGLDALKPTNVSATAGDQQATVTWTAPAVSLPTITGYVVKTFDAADDSLLATSGSTTDAHLTVEGLKNGRAVYFKVTATTLLVVSAESGASNPVTPAGVASAVSDVALVGGDSQVLVAWNPPDDNNGSPVESYEVDVFEGQPTGNPIDTVFAGPESHSVTVTGLENGSVYSFEVKSVNAAGPSESSEARLMVPAGLPFAPSILGAEVMGPNEVRILWEPSENGNNGSAITRHEVKTYPPCASCGGLVVGGMDYTTIVTGLEPNASYFFTVVPTNAVGAGPESAPSAQVTTDPAEATPPDPGSLGAPQNLEVIMEYQVSEGDVTTTATISWGQPEGPTPSEYEVEAYPGGQPVIVNGSTNSVVLEGLDGKFTTYTFIVTARTAGSSSFALSEPFPSLRVQADALLGIELPEFLTVYSNERPEPFDWEGYDGCSFPGLDPKYEDMCLRHDFGYQNYGPGSELILLRAGDKRMIDTKLRDDIKEYECGDFSLNPATVACYAVADGTYRVLYLFGGPAWCGGVDEPFCET